MKTIGLILCNISNYAFKHAVHVISTFIGAMLKGNS